MGKRLLFFIIFFISVNAYSQCPLQLNVDSTVSCNGGNDGQITVTPITPGWYEYHFEFWYTNVNIWLPLGRIWTNLPATFPLLQSDSIRVWADMTNDSTNNAIPNGCVSQVAFISQPVALISNSTSTDESSPGACDGSISVFVSGGTPPYNFSWTGPSGYTSNNQNINNLCAGIYILTLTDTNGCSITLSDTINSPSICQVSVTVTEDVSCPGGNDGAAFLTHNGNYINFSWDNLTNGQNYGSGNITNLNNLVSGWYQVSCTALVGSGCPDTVSNLFPIIEPKDTITSSLSVCGGDSIPILVYVIFPKDSVLYSYSIDGGSASFPDSTFSDSLQVGSHYYTIFAIDTSNGFSDTICFFSSPFNIVNTSITININIDSTLVTCIGGDGSITINAVGGVGILEYSINGGNNFYPDSIFFPTLNTGNYNVFVQEFGGCMQSYANNPVVIDSTSINFVINSVTTIKESCCGNDGMIILDIDTLGSGSALTYSIDTGNTFFTDSILTNLTAGNYYVIVKDANGCDTALGNVAISADSTPDIDMSVHVTDIVCNGDTNGTFRVLDPDTCYSYVLWRYTISPPYYLPIDTGTYFNGLIPGSYGVIATSNTGNCIDSSLAIVINEPTSLIQNGIAVKEVRCSNNDTCDGEITLSSAPTGGIPPYYYSILDYGNNIPFGPIGSDSTFSGLCTDSFEVTLFDANACKVIDTVLVADSTLYIDSVITTNVTCFGYNNGTAIVYSHGGYRPYSYIWSNGDSTMIADSLSNTQYSVIVADTQNCLAYDTINISQPGELFFNIKVPDGYKLETCKGISYDGEFYMNYQGGTTPFNWSWIGASGATDSGFGDTIPNLTFDTLTLFVTDSNGCIGQPAWIHADSARVDALNALNPLTLDTIIADSILCFGTTSATIFIDVKSGEAAYSYSVDGGLTFTTDSIFTNLPAGNYNIYIMDAYGCLDSAIVNIVEYNELIINYDSVKHVSCYNGHDGFLSSSINGGVPPYQKIWNYPTSLREVQCFDNPDGITLIGAWNWSYKDFIIPDGFKIDSIFMDATRVGYPDEEHDFSAEYCVGVTIFNPATATPLVDYTIITMSLYNNWINSFPTIPQGVGVVRVLLPTGTGATWNDLCFAISESAADDTWRTDGMYTIKVVDLAGCTKTETMTLIELTLPLTSNAVVTSHASCYDSADGSATISVQGGMPPYTVNWGVGVYTNALDTGTYIIEINDSFNCGPIYDTVEILQPDEFLINILSTTPNPCFGDALGEIILIASGGTMPYNQYFARDVLLNILDSTSSPNIIGLTASDYDVWVHDASGCPSDTLKAVKIGEPGEIQISASSDSLTCFGSEDGVLELTLIGGTSPYEYVFSEGSSILTSGNINQTIPLIFNALAANTYTLNVLDNNGCPKTSVFILSEPVQIIADFTSDNTSGKETFTVNLTNTSQGGADVFVWDYDDGGNQETLGIGQTASHSYIKQGQYEIMLVAENSLLSTACNDTTFQTIDVQGFDVFNVFSPNDDGVNDIFDFDGWSLSSMYVEIYNRWGEKIYHWDSPNGSWNGKTYNDDDAPDGVYYFYLKANGEDGYLYQQQGSITLLR